MRFLLLNQFYPPDGAPTGRMLRDLGQTLVSRGHQVRVICSRLGYDGSTDWGRIDPSEGVQVVRTGGIRFRRDTVIGRVAAYATFFVGALRAAMSGPAPDTVVSLTTPPFLGIAGSLIARLRGGRHAHWTMDLYPEALRAHWNAAKNPLLWSLLRWLGRAQFRGAAVVVTPGSCVEERTRAYLEGSVPSQSVPLWTTDDVKAVDANDVAAEREVRGWNADDLVLMYSGNMGLGHTFAEFLEAARRHGGSGAVWTFIGNGPRRGEIEKYRVENPTARVELLDYVESSRLAVSLASADVHLVSLARGWEGVMVPSKLQNAFSVGRPVIFVGPQASEPAIWIRECGGGWVVPTADVDALLAAAEEARQPAERARRGAAALQYAAVHFDRDRNCARIAELLERFSVA